MMVMDNNSKIEALLFDFDGTLIDASEVICSCFNHALSSQGLQPLDADQIKPMIGTPLREMFAPFSDRTDLDALLKGYRKAFNELSPGRSHLIPGVSELVNQIDSGIKLGVVTSRTSRGARQILDEFGLLERFAVLVGIEDVEKGKPDPEGVLTALSQISVTPVKAAFVGDTVFDIEAGRNAGTLTIGVTTGYHSRTELSDAGADRIIDRLTEILEFLTERRRHCRHY